MMRISDEEWLALRSRGAVRMQSESLEASIVPARETHTYGTLGHVKRAFRFEESSAQRKMRQRQKIWVR